ncbi:MAG: hypothetical protein COA86_12850 [Kangiella sp.]|nr:MAG: hypothetical protein COA86_12850 [Kangiella sp.]
MNSIENISLFSLSWILLPVSIVIFIQVKWALEIKTNLYALLRMLIQLLMIGYFLVFIFKTDDPWIVTLVLAVMLLVASWIALRTIKEHRYSLFGYGLLSILVGGGSVLAVVIIGVLDLSPWYSTQFFIPLAGMIFASAMNSISLAAERYYAEIANDIPYHQARNKAFEAALIPIVNSLFAVGLVSLPGMMTGQILSGVSPFIAARYQIMVMCMIFAASGLSAALFLYLIKDKK